jgi:hypothetical protein
MSKDTAAMPAHIIVIAHAMFACAMYDYFNWTASISRFWSSSNSDWLRLKCMLDPVPESCWLILGWTWKID